MPGIYWQKMPDTPYSAREMQAAPSPQQTSVRVENVTSLKGLIQGDRIADLLPDLLPGQPGGQRPRKNRQIDEIGFPAARRSPARNRHHLHHPSEQHHPDPCGGTYGYGHVSAVQSYVRQHRELENIIAIISKRTGILFYDFS